MPSAVPNYNGLIAELQEAKKGWGLHLRTVGKVNSMKHLRRVFSQHGGQGDFNTARAVRNALADFVDACDTLTEKNKVVLDHILNLKDAHDHKLGGRQSSLEVALGVGKRKRASEEESAILLLADRLLSFVAV